MEILDEKKLEIAETYAVDLVKLKLSKSIFSNFKSDIRPPNYNKFYKNKSNA